MADVLKNVALDLFNSWRVSYDEALKGFDRTFAADNVWVNEPLMTTHGPEGAKEIWRLCKEMQGLETLHVDIHHIWENGRFVIIERVDKVYRADGTLVHGFPLVGVMRFNDDDKIEHWTEYFDAGAVHDSGLTLSSKDAKSS
ncbi:limonene-1,2-epoxide hydrolase family protein [Rhodococcus oxybenzonivorans]|nr:limonene-1,2-epoxide hydrolase family protein [Rhodococcus oxybenzonivorans]